MGPAMNGGVMIFQDYGMADQLSIHPCSNFTVQVFNYNVTLYVRYRNGPKRDGYIIVSDRTKIDFAERPSLESSSGLSLLRDGRKTVYYSSPERHIFGIR